MKPGAYTGALLALLILLSTVSCDMFSSRSRSPQVFSVNLSSSRAQLKLQEGKTPLFEVKDLDPFETRPLLAVVPSRGVSLSAVTGSRQTASEWKDPSGIPYNLRLEDGKIYCILVDPQGNATLSALSQEYTNDPKICLLNGISEPLAQLQVAPDFNRNVKIYVQDLPPSQPTEFFSLKPKTVGFFWQTTGQTFTSEFFRLEKDGIPVLQSMESGHLYLFLAANGIPGGMVHGKLWDLTRQDK